MYVVLKHLHLTLIVGAVLMFMLRFYWAQTGSIHARNGRVLQASGWLSRARYEHVLCAHIDLSPDACTAYWLRLDANPLENCGWRLNLTDISVRASAQAIADTPDLPAQLVSANAPKLALHSRHSLHRTVEFVRSQPVR